MKKPFQFGLRAIFLLTAGLALLIGLPLYHPILTGVLAYVAYLVVAIIDYRETERLR